MQWRRLKLGDIYSVFSGLSKGREEFGFGHPFLTFKDVFYNYFVPDELISLANTTEKERDKCSIRKGDVFLTRTSETVDELGMSCVALKDYAHATFNGFTKRLRLKPDCGIQVDPVFFGYYLRSVAFRQQVNAVSSITTRASLNATQIIALEIELPEYEEQVSIGRMLKPLDDKIELNRRMNATLQAMAQALFKEWFVDGAKDEWEEVPFAQTVKVYAGGTPKTRVAEYWDGDIPWFAIADAAPSDVFVIDTERKVSQAGIDNSSAQVVKAGTTILTARGTVGQTVMTGVPMAMNQSCFGLWGKHDRYGYYTYFQTKHVAELFQQYSHGSVFSTINRSTFETLHVKAPDPKVITDFEELVCPMMQRILNNLNENSTLASLRDTLLPKLMRGEVRVKEKRLV